MSVTDFLLSEMPCYDRMGNYQEENALFGPTATETSKNSKLNTVSIYI